MSAGRHHVKSTLLQIAAVGSKKMLALVERLVNGGA
jgi:hypothetical protein